MMASSIDTAATTAPQQQLASFRHEGQPISSAPGASRAHQLGVRAPAALSAWPSFVAQITLLFALVAACSAFVAPGVVPAAQQRSVAPCMMSKGETSTRRALLGSLLLLPAAAQAVVPGLNGPGLVPQKPSGSKPAWEDVRDRSSFWSSKGVS